MPFYYANYLNTHKKTPNILVEDSKKKLFITVFFLVEWEN